MKTLDRTAILAAPSLRMEQVAVPEWGGAVWVREMSAAERDRWEAALVRFEDGKVVPNRDGLRALRAALSICDESGALLFDQADAEQLGRLSAAALDRITAVAERLAGDEAAMLEGATKNSAPGQTGP